MTIEEIIAERDSILNNLYDGLIEPSEGLTVAQTHRQKALEAFLSQDIHHSDLAEAMNRFFSEAIDTLSHDELSNKLAQYTEDAYFLNQKAGRDILPTSLRLERLFEAGDLDRLSKNQTTTLRTTWNSLIKDINTQDLYMGIRHVMPESLEMRQLINNTDSYIAMLEAYNKPSMRIDNYAQLEWRRVPPAPENITWTNQYKAPQTLEELKAMFGRFKEEFPKKAREFILGQNILLEENPEPRLWNEEYYQFTGWGTGTSDMPVSQMNTHLKEFYDKLLGLERNEMMDLKAMELGFDDANDWFNKLLEGEKYGTPGYTIADFDLARKSTLEDAQNILKEKLGSFYEVSPFDSVYDDVEFALRPVDKSSELGNAAYKVIDKPLDTPTNVVDTVGSKNIKQPSALDDLPLDIDPRLDDWEYELIDRPDDMSVDEFLKKNNVTELQYNAVFEPENLPEGFEDRIVQRGGSWLNLITVKEGVTPDELRKAIELVAQKTPHQSVKEFIYSQYETFDNIKNKIPGPVAEKTLNNINKDIAAILFDYSNEVYDPKGGGMATDLYYRNKIDEGFMPIIDKGVDENVIEKAVLKEFIPDYGVDQLPAPGWAEQRVGNALRMAQEDLTIEGEVIPDTPQLDTPTNVVDDVPPNQTLRVMEESGLSSHSERVRKVAQDYHKIMGYSDPEFKPAMVFNDEIGAVAADIFEQLPMYDDAAIPYYNKFIKETNMQYQTLLDSGMQFELTDTDPYTPNRAGHTQMINDMENGVLKVLSTESGFGNEATNAANPMLKNSIYTDINGRVMLENDVFRAVHDTFGHGMRGNTFGPVGEYNAWLAHKEMYSSDARRVMTTETLGQNTYTNYGQHMRDANGNLLSKGDPNYLKPADRPFAPQKVAVMPQDIIETAGKVVDDASELVDVNSLNKVIEIANTNPGVADNLFNSAKKIVGKVFGTAGAIADPGDIAITQGITRILPRLGLAAIAAPALSAYIGYELIVLLADAANAFNVATQNQDVNLLEYNPDVDWKKVGKDTWQEFGEVSDTWSLSWKISEPIIDYAFNEYAKLQENR